MSGRLRRCPRTDNCACRVQLASSFAPRYCCRSRCAHRSKIVSVPPNGSARSGLPRQGRISATPPRVEPELEVFHQRLCLGLPYGAPDVRRLAANSIFDGVELTDAAHRLGRDRRSGCDMDVIELATRMGEAECKRHGATRTLRIKQSIVAGVSIDLQNAVESLKQLGSALALAILCKHVDDRRRRRAAPWPVIRGRHP